MMQFSNGHAYAFAARYVTSLGPEGLPWVAVDIAFGHNEFDSVVGIVDTGAFQTILTVETAKKLGIENPMSEAHRKPKKGALSATDAPISYYNHLVVAQVESDQGSLFSFSFKAGVSEAVTRNLFGVDWLDHLCLAFDKTSVHFLRD